MRDFLNRKSIRGRFLLTGIAVFLFCTAKPLFAVDWRPPAPISCPQNVDDFDGRNLISDGMSWLSLRVDENGNSEDFPMAQGKIIRSRGRWLVDTNHLEFGELLVLAFLRTQTYIDINHVVGTGVRGCPDLRHASIKIDLTFAPRPIGSQADRNNESVKAAELVFWFQSVIGEEMGGKGPRYLNYAYRGQNLLKGQEFASGKFDIPRLPVDLGQWQCLGRNRTDLRPDVGSAQKYSCATNQEEFERALSEVNVNFGLLLLLPKTDEMGNRRMWINSVNPLRTGALPKGQLEVRWFSIERAQ